MNNDRAFLPPAGWLDREQPEDSVPVGWPFLIGVTVVAAALRLFRLGYQSLWVDEIMTWKMVRPDAVLVFWEQITDAIQGPLYLAAIWPLLRIADNEVMIRLPAALAGILAVPLLGIAVGQLLGRRCGYLAALLLAINPFHIWYSQEARGYAFVILLTIALALVWLDMVRRGPRWSMALLFALLTACGVWSNISFLFFWAALGLTLLVAARPREARGWGLWSLAFAGGLLIAAPWLARASGIWAVDRIVPGAAMGVALRGDSTASIIDIPYTVFGFFFGKSLGPTLPELHQQDKLAVLLDHLVLLSVCALAMGPPLLAGILRLPRRRLYLLLWIVVPLVAATVLAVRNIKPYNTRYVATALPWLVMLVAHGIISLPRRLAASVSLVLIGLTIWSVVNYHFVARYHKADLRAAAAWIEESNVAGEPIFVPVVTGVFGYYYGGSGRLIDTFNQPVVRNAAAARDLVAGALVGVDDCWVILSRSWFVDPGDRLPAALDEAGRVTLETRKTGVRIYRWQRDTDQREEEFSSHEG